MKKFAAIAAGLLAAVFLLGGCGEDVSEERDPAEVLVGENPCDIYFATGNDYYDLYAAASWMPGPEITLLSREEIDPETIQVSLDIQTPYTVYVTQQEIDRSLSTYEIQEVDGVREVTETDFGSFPLYLYQCYAGMDWKALGEAYADYFATMEQYENGEVELDQLKAAGAAYDNKATEYVEDYMGLEVSDLPQFYVYTIQVFISEAEKEESFTSVQVTIGDTVHNVEIGQVILKPTPEQNLEAFEYLCPVGSPPYFISTFPYGEGIAQCQYEVFYTEEPLTLTGLDYWENTMSTAEVVDVTVVLADSRDNIGGGNGVEIPWDGTTPIYVEQGKYVTLFFTVQDPRMQEINYHSKLYPVLEFDCQGSRWETACDLVMYRNYNDIWLLYALGLDGMSLESYFNDYYYVMNSVHRSRAENSEANP